LSAKGIDLEYVSPAAVMVRIDEDFEMIIQVLTDIAPKLGGDDPRGLSIKTMNSEVDGMRGIEDANLRFLGRWFTFAGFPLTKVGDRLRGLP
jgi:hypothetical protein